MMKTWSFNKIVSIASLCALIATTAGAVSRADRVARVDAEGVMRWVDDQSEVALVGVNYYSPFTVDFKHLKMRKADIKAVMREDVAHFRRLGLGVMRIHCFDREFSTADGGFIDNEHVELLDYLIDIGAASRTLVLHARSGEARTDKLEIVFVFSNGQPWGTNVELTPEWRDIRISLDSLRYFTHWHAPSISAADKPDIARLQAVSFCFGRWLYPSTYAQSHSIEISSLHVE